MRFLFVLFTFMVSCRTPVSPSGDGGGGRDDSSQEKVFHIYTTGFANWGEGNMVQNWRGGYKEKVIEAIPSHFAIEFHHFDPLVNPEGNGELENEELRRATAFFTALVEEDQSHERVRESSFTQEPFDVGQVPEDQPHLILDGAHLYFYPAQKGMIRENSGEGRTFQRASLRVGFLRQEERQELANRKLFSVSDEGEVTTYIDRMIEKGIYTREYAEPSDILFLGRESVLHHMMGGLERLIDPNNDLTPQELAEALTQHLNMGILFDTVFARIWLDGAYTLQELKDEVFINVRDNYR